MNQEQQRISIAEWMEPNHKWEIYEDIYSGAKEPYTKHVGYRYPAHSGWINSKDYPNDLNAMHEAEKKLTTAQKAFYREKLHFVVKRDYSASAKLPYSSYIWLCVTATSQQRSEALCRTLWPERWAK